MALRRLATVAISCAIFVVISCAGAPDNRGTEFVIGFTKNFAVTGKNDLFITCLQDTTVTVEAPGVKFKQTFTLKSKELKTVSVPVSLRMIAGVENKGVLVTSTEEVIVYGISLVKATTDAFLALPTDIQSDRYIIPAIKANPGNSNLGIVASRDGTKITVKPPGQAVTTHTLNRLQTYYYGASIDLTGTIVTADKPVSVYSGAECTRVGGIGACDHLVEQIPPVDTWGKRFATVPIAERRVGDIFRVLASEDNTVVEIAAKSIKQVLNTAKFFEIDIPSSEFQLITCSKPCLVVQYNKGQGSDIKADPFMILIPPIEQYAANYVISTSKTADGDPYENHLSVAIESKHKNDLLLDGKPLTVTWNNIPGTNLVGASLTIKDGRHELYHKSPIVPFAAYIYGYRSYDSYGYPGGLRLAPIAIPCVPTTAQPLDGLDNDCDGLIDEELKNGIDDDGDGKIDEDIVALPPALITPANFTASVCNLADKSTYVPAKAGQLTVKASPKCEVLGATKVTHQDNQISNANCEAFIERVWSVLDGCKNTVEYTQYIKLSVPKPTFTVIPTESLLCTNANEVKGKTAWNPSVKSNPCPTNRVTITEKTPSTSYSGKCTGQTISRTWQARENCGRVTTLTQKVTLQGLAPPTLTKPKDYTNQVCDLLSKTDIDPAMTGRLTAKAHANCEKLAATKVSYADKTVSNANCKHVIQRTWTATDGCRQTATHVQTITLDTLRPTIVGTVKPTASVVCTDVSEVKGRTDLNPVLQPNPCPKNKISISETTPSTSFAGKCNGQTVSRTWKVNEACGRVTTLTQKVTVLAKVAPTQTNPKDYTAQVCDLLSTAEVSPSKTGQLTAKAHANCEALGATKVTYADKTITNANCKHMIKRTWSVTDGCRHTSSHVQTITLEMKKPTVTATQTSSMLCIDVNEVKGRTDLNPRLQTNPCPANKVTISETTPSSVFTAKCNGQTITRTWQAREACGRVSTVTQRVAVKAKVPPKENTPKDYVKNVCNLNDNAEINPTKTGRLTAVVSPDCEATKATTIDYTDKTFAYANCEKRIQRTWVLRDGCGHAINHVQNIRLVISEPTVTVAPNGDIVCLTANEAKTPTALQPKLTANPCPANKVTVTDTTPAETYAEACKGQTAARTWQVRESCGRVKTLNQNVVVKAKVAPKDNKPTDYVKNVCNVNDQAEINRTKTGRLTAVVSPNCEAIKATTIDYTDKTIANANCEKRIQRTWVLRDGCGHTINHVQNIRLVIAEPTVTVAPNGDIVCLTVNEAKTPAALQPKLTANPCPANKVTVTDTTPAETYAEACKGQTAARTWQVRESCGRVKTLNQNVVAKAKVAPKDNKPTDYVKNVCNVNDQAEINPTKTGRLTAVVSPDCEAIKATTIDYTDKTITNANCEKRIQRTWVLRDGCGHTINHVQNIRLVISEPTVTVAPNGDIVCLTVNEAKTPSALQPKLTANPCPANKVTVTDTTPAETYAEACKGQTAARTWQVRESCGRVKTLNQNVVAKAKVAPKDNKPTDYVKNVCNVNDQAEINPTKTGRLTAVVSPNCEAIKATTIDYTDKTITNANCEKRIQRTWVLRDGCGHTINHVQNIRLVISEPTVTVAPNGDIVCLTVNEAKTPAALQPKLTANPCPANKVTVTDTTPAETYAEACKGQTAARTWQVRESCGRVKTLNQNVVAKAKVAPKDNKPTDYVKNVCNVNDQAEINPTKTGRLTAVVSPNCEAIKATTIGYTDKTIANANCEKRIQRTWVLRDGCGHTINHVQNIRLVIAEPTVTVAPNGDIVCLTVNEAKTPAALQPKLTANPCPANKVTVTDTTPAETYAEACKGQTAARTWQVRESCGRVKTLNQNVVAKAKVAPKDNKPTDYVKNVCNVNDNAEINPTKTGRLTAVVSPDCETIKATTIDYTDKTIANANCEKRIQRTWVLRDGCGHTINHVQNIRLVITEPTVTVASKGERLCSTVNEAKVPNDLQPKVVANPCPANKVTITDTTVAGTYVAACKGQTVQRTWRVRETCGREETLKQTFVAIAKVPPKTTKPTDYTASVCDINSASEIVPSKTGAMTAVVSPECVKVAPTQLTNSDQVFTSFGCQKVIERRWSLTDGCGFTESHVQWITLTIPKSTVTVLPTAEMECDNIAEATSNAAFEPKVTSNPCPGNNKVTFKETTTPSLLVGECKDQVITRTWTAKEACGRTQTLSQKLTLKEKGCFARVADIVFALDTSGSLTDSDFTKMLNFVKNLVKTFDIGYEKTRVGLLLYNDDPQPQFQLNTYFSKPEILTAIDGMRKTFGSTKTNAAIEYMRQSSFSVANGDRVLAKNVGIVITDGKSGSRVLTSLQARLAKVAGVIMFAIGVGDDVDANELNDIASDLDSSYVFTVDNFGALTSIQNEVAIGACVATNPPTTIPTTTPASTLPPTTPPPCVDKTNCKAYGDNVCTEFPEWARTNCYNTCYCKSTPAPVATTKAACVDTLSNCNLYKLTYCNEFKQWAQANCAKFCGLC